jgi:hypothetical protein
MTEEKIRLGARMGFVGAVYRREDRHTVNVEVVRFDEDKGRLLDFALTIVEAPHTTHDDDYTRAIFRDGQTLYFLQHNLLGEGRFWTLI